MVLDQDVSEIDDHNKSTVPLISQAIEKLIITQEEQLN